MPELNHHIVAASDKEETSLFFADVLGLEQPTTFGPFAVLKVSEATTLDFVDADGDIAPLHYAFLVTEEEFDQIFTRIRERCLPYWSDPYKTDHGNINHWDDGRGVYFPDPNGHMLEIITRPYGSGGTEAEHPHPLVAAPVQPSADGQRPIGTACAEPESPTRGPRPGGS